MRPALVAIALPLLLSTSTVRATGAGDYADARRRLQDSRARLARAHRAARTPVERQRVVERAREAVLAALDAELVPAWLGTPWDFYGTSQTPGEGAIACGYFVSTVLRDAGFRVEHVRLAQQASENIVRTLVPPAEVRRYRWKRPAEVVARVREELGDGLFVVGLDFHVGFLRLQAGRATFCHSAWLEPTAVTCEPAERSAGLASDYYVVGRLLSDSMMTRWLEGRRFQTRGAVGR